MKPLISVLIPYLDCRRTPELVRNWTQRQTLAAEKFEVIVIIGTAEKDELELKKCLRSQDRLIRSDTKGPFPRYVAGASVARGEIIFFTEDHVVGASDCLSAVEKFFEQHSDHEKLVGAGVRWGHISRTSVARNEQKLNEADQFHVMSEKGHWNSLRVRGFALKRAIYEELGGFDARYGAFSEALLSARLDASGYKVGFIEDTIVKHINTDTLSEIYRNVSNYALNEADFCANNDQQFCHHYFRASKVLLEDVLLPRSCSVWLARALALVICREVSKSFRKFVKQPYCALWFKEMFCLAVFNTTELIVERAIALLRLLSAGLRFSFSRCDDDRRLAAFREFWDGTRTLSRFNYAARTKNRLRCVSASSFDASNPCNSVACNEPEQYYETHFLWTKLASIFLFNVPAGDYAVSIDTGGVARGHCDGVASIFWNEHLLAEQEVVFDDEKLLFRIKEEMFREGSEQRLTIVCKPHSRSAWETRTLGIPVSAIALLKGNEAIPTQLADETDLVGEIADRVPAMVGN